MGGDAEGGWEGDVAAGLGAEGEDGGVVSRVLGVEEVADCLCDVGADWVGHFVSTEQE